jgi:LmbE family N-acetylglucosaminyl deacetylase
MLSARFDQAEEVWTLAWEGGHHDHHAAHLVALAFAAGRGARCFEVPLYTGFRRVGRSFASAARSPAAGRRAN